MSVGLGITPELVSPMSGFPPTRSCLRSPAPGLLSCLNEARFWHRVRHHRVAQDSSEARIDHWNSRVQSDRPISGFQMDPEEALPIWPRTPEGDAATSHLGRPKDAGNITTAQVSTGKLNNAREALTSLGSARGILWRQRHHPGVPVIRHMNNPSRCTPTRAPTRSTLVIGEGR